MKQTYKGHFRVLGRRMETRQFGRCRFVVTRNGEEDIQQITVVFDQKVNVRKDSTISFTVGDEPKTKEIKDAAEEDDFFLRRSTK